MNAPIGDVQATFVTGSPGSSTVAMRLFILEPLPLRRTAIKTRFNALRQIRIDAASEYLEGRARQVLTWAAHFETREAIEAPQRLVPPRPAPLNPKP